MRRNLAARIGVWSTHHRKTAVLGWLLFVVLATGIGGATGMVEMTNAENGAGESARAEQILLDAGLDKPAGELVMVSAPPPATGSRPPRPSPTPYGRPARHRTSFRPSPRRTARTP